MITVYILVSAAVAAALCACFRWAVRPVRGAYSVGRQDERIIHRHRMITMPPAVAGPYALARDVLNGLRRELTDPPGEHPDLPLWTGRVGQALCDVLDGLDEAYRRPGERSWP